jgi:hypothetical protein
MRLHDRRSDRGGSHRLVRALFTSFLVGSTLILVGQGAGGAAVGARDGWAHWGQPLRVPHALSLPPEPAQWTPRVVPRTAATRETAESTNWAGYFDTGPQFTGVSGQWTVPVVQPSQDDQVSSTWLGVDGVLNTSLIQTGTTQETSEGTTLYFAWYEVLPAPAIPIGLVDPGDQMSANITESSPGTWILSIADVTSEQEVSGQLAYDGPGTSAEWIEEAPSAVDGDQFTLANFGMAQFGTLGVSGTNLGSGTDTPIEMTDSIGDVIAYPGPILDDGFSVTYGSPNSMSAGTDSPTSTALAVSPATPSFGTPVTYSATVTSPDGTPTGSVGIADGSTKLCTVELVNGAGSCAAANAPAGDDTITAAYAGDTGFTASSGTATLTVAKSTTTTSASVSPAEAVTGQSVTYAATVSSSTGTPTGTVAFSTGSTVLCTTSDLQAGSASCTASGAPQGTDAVTATYAGDANFALSTGTTALNVAAAHGYWLVGSDGGIFSFGDAGFHGSTGSLRLQRPVVGITPTADDAGYWLVASDGGIFSFGDAQFHGSIPGLGFAPAGSSSPKRLNAPIVAMVPSADGGGYFMVASDGGVFAFGDATFAGSCPGIGGCAGPAVAVIPDPSGGGYWLVTSNGYVYDFGDAASLGAPGPQSSPVTAAVRTPDGGGYWIILADGSVDSFGNAGILGQPLGSVSGSNPATSVFSTSDGGGYWVASANGSVFDYGDAPSLGGLAGQRLNGPIVAGTGW